MIELDIRNISHTRHKNFIVKVGDTTIDLGLIDNTECLDLARKLSGYIDELLYDITTGETDGL
tara:strand:- start:1327 stop:1515 length:189 start_codon:yes stop_codon:yes gene_type:complete